MELLEQHGGLDRTIVVVVGDHGEALEEHGEPTHATYVYDATMKVPLLIAAPHAWLARGRSVPSQVSTVDIAPTVLELLGMAPVEGMQGRSLAGALRDPESLASQPILLESHFGLYQFGWAPLRAVRTGSWKYILAPRPELYDLTRDPGELDNVAGARPDTLKELGAELDELASRLSWPDPARSAATSIDSETRDRLEALGYVGGGGSAQRARAFPSPEELARLPNPIDGALALHYVNVTSELIRNRRFDVAISVTRQGLAVDPHNYRLHYTLGYALFGDGQLDGALTKLQQVAEMNPSDAAPHLIIGRIHGIAGDYELAKSSLSRAIELEPNRIDALALLGLTQAKLSDLDGAAQTLRKALEVDPDSWSVRLRLGRVLADSGKLEEAREAFQQAMHANPYSPEVLATIGVFYMQLGNLDFARQALEQAVRTAPNDPALRVHLAEAILRSGADEGAARSHLEHVVRVSPNSQWAETARRYLEGSPQASGNP
jgi:Flp pilus assembly protein TadD